MALRWFTACDDSCRVDIRGRSIGSVDFPVIGSGEPGSGRSWSLGTNGRVGEPQSDITIAEARGQDSCVWTRTMLIHRDDPRADTERLDENTIATAMLLPQVAMPSPMPEGERQVLIRLIRNIEAELRYGREWAETTWWLDGVPLRARQLTVGPLSIGYLTEPIEGLHVSAAGRNAALEDLRLYRLSAEFGGRLPTGDEFAERLSAALRRTGYRDPTEIDDRLRAFADRSPSRGDRRPTDPPCE
ncbi:hypothetical protein D5S17_18970 [Pseudonocardiaceae bacterium YIM PH 21723]|nr:hypothetical protein D5S17_18970 [Pseudonocardiaceae bacterium YIM PH 21723]